MKKCEMWMNILELNLLRSPEAIMISIADRMTSKYCVQNSAIFVGTESSEHREAGLAWPCWRRQLEVISC